MSVIRGNGIALQSAGARHHAAMTSVEESG
jgi:hypothetical protein